MSKKEQFGALYGFKPGRNQSGVKTDFGRRNHNFINARIAARAGERSLMEASIRAMEAIQPITKREREAIERHLPERRQPMPRQ